MSYRAVPFSQIRTILDISYISDGSILDTPCISDGRILDISHISDVCISDTPHISDGNILFILHSAESTFFDWSYAPVS